jgi:predicted nicotinamide N-methyase
MAKKPGREIRAYGIRVLLSRHPEIRRLKQAYFPTVHGNKLWTSSWLLMDYFHRRGLPEGARIMEVGCGWGLAGIYCAKKHKARVTSVDMDREVFPFTHLHARINGVQVRTLEKSFGGISGEHLRITDVLIGSDICFWDRNIYALKRLILKAIRSGVQMVLIADPVREPFEQLGEYFEEKQGGEVLEWTARRPRRIEGQILKIGTFGPGRKA